jgi:hypothetical protein
VHPKNRSQNNFGSYSHLLLSSCYASVMNKLIKLEELGMLGLGIFLFSQLPYAWWWFIVLLLTPDIGMIGYLINPKIGAMTYNLLHHKLIAIAIYLFWNLFKQQYFTACGSNNVCPQQHGSAVWLRAQILGFVYAYAFRQNRAKRGIM